VVRSILNSFLFFPERGIARRPEEVGLAVRELEIDTDDGERLDGWLVRSGDPWRGHVLFCHGDGGNIGDRVEQARLLASAGFEVLLFDYRGYGRSSGRPSEGGTYRDARSARDALLRHEEADEFRLIYLGESLGGAVALALASRRRPSASSFSPRSRASETRPGALPTPPADLDPGCVSQPPPRRGAPGVRSGRTRRARRDRPELPWQELFEAPPEPKVLGLLPDAGHNDLVDRAGDEYAEAIASWCDGIGREAGSPGW
jgi:pimeloyl-ACP methyl ester carboxylesterase